MGIVTRKGDTGETSLADGSRVSKSNPQIEAYGNVDELNSWLGLIRQICLQKNFQSLADSLTRIQRECFVIGSHLATPAKKLDTAKLPAIDPAATDRLEADVVRLEGTLPALKNFILPGGPEPASSFQIARTVARRAERAVAALVEKNSAASWKECLRYLNRLSDWCFIMARKCTVDLGAPEDIWKA